MKARYVVGCTIITLLSVVTLANFYYETAPEKARQKSVKLTQSAPTKQLDVSAIQRKDQQETMPVPSQHSVGTKQTTNTVNPTNQELFRVTRVAHKDDRIYRSTITPVVKNIITSPVNGQLDNESRRYGDHIKKGDKIVGIISEEARNQLLSDTVNYISNRDSFYLSESEVKKNTELHKRGIVSKQELKQSESAYVRAMIEMVRARIRLKITAERLDFDWQKVEKIHENRELLGNQSTSTSQQVIEYLLNKDYIVNIHAENDGILLPKYTGQGNVEFFDFNLGSEVRERAPIGMIADPNHISVRFVVSEFEVLSLSVNQSVQLTIPVMDNQQLSGKITEINRFDFRSRGGQSQGIPVTAELSCGKIPCDQLFSISADIKAVNDETNPIQVPINAVVEENGQFYVQQIINSKPVKQQVTTGETTRDMIIIKSGLVEGDQIVRNYPATEN